MDCGLRSWVRDRYSPQRISGKVYKVEGTLGIQHGWKGHSERPSVHDLSDLRRTAGGD
ncbi:MAG: hypothetical protein WBI17_02370 [Clostridiaceae bacterium]